MLDFQKAMEERKKRNSLKPLSGVENIPGTENCAEGETMGVNHLHFEIYNKEKGEAAYKNSWITDIEINKGNVENMAACVRWKTGNAHNMRHNNVLKNHGYNLEHNFGHGQNHANGIFCLLNLLAFLFHGIQRPVDGDYRKACNSFGRKIDFFWGLRYEVNRYFHKNWVSLFLTVSGCPPDG
jgi:hypothetical protein